MTSNIWYGCYDNGNFGDHLGRYVIEKMTGVKPRFIHPSNEVDEVYVYSGSVLQEAKSNWMCFGLGFGDYNQTCKEEPKHIFSVRGKMTKEILLKQGIKCPDKFFDIAEFLPALFYPKIEKEYEIGYIPHYLDYNEYKEQSDSKTNVIDILSSTENVITEALKCKEIRSTSLHGLILADVYKIPRLWEKSKNLESEFKFHDYFSSK